MSESYIPRGENKESTQRLVEYIYPFFWFDSNPSNPDSQGYYPLNQAGLGGNPQPPDPAQPARWYDLLAESPAQPYHVPLFAPQSEHAKISKWINVTDLLPYNNFIQLHAAFVGGRLALKIDDTPSYNYDYDYDTSPYAFSLVHRELRVAQLLNGKSSPDLSSLVSYLLLVFTGGSSDGTPTTQGLYLCMRGNLLFFITAPIVTDGNAYFSEGSYYYSESDDLPPTKSPDLSSALLSMGTFTQEPTEQLVKERFSQLVAQDDARAWVHQLGEPVETNTVCEYLYTTQAPYNAGQGLVYLRIDSALFPYCERVRSSGFITYKQT